jgi:CBS domain-containing protein
VTGLAPTTERRVAELMTWALETAEVATTCREARRICAARAVHHLPVVEGGILVGIICTCDLRGAAADEHLGRRMRTPVVTIRPDAPTRDALGTMRDADVGALPVLYHGFLIGIVTAGDLERAGLQSTRGHCALCGARHHVRATPRGRRCVACWEIESGGKE